MSVARRVFSGSMASWSKIALGVGIQLALVPVYLSHWSLEEFGCWLVIQATAAFANVFSLAHHNYLGNELLRVPRGDAVALSRLLSAAWPFSLGWGLIEVLAVAGLVAGGLLKAPFDPNEALAPALLDEAQWSLVLLCAATYLSVSTSGLYGRLAAALAHFPRTAWWGVAIQIVTALAPLTAVVSGQGLSTAAWLLAGAHVAVYLIYQIDLMRLAARHGVSMRRPDWPLGWRHFRASTMLGATYLLGLVRQQGLRVLVSGMLGVAQAVAFTTMRTASNLSLQGIATVVDPVFPEFIGFVRDRNRAAVVATMAFLWLVIVFALGPSLVLLQAFAPWLFELWTRGQVPFDPWVFAAFSAAMLVFALARPADSLLLGHNRLGAQFGIASIAALVTVAGILVLDGRGGLQGIAALLVVVEIGVAALTIHRACVVLAKHGLQWPAGLFRFALAHVVVCVACMAWIAGRPDDRASAVSASMLAGAVLLAGFFVQLPETHRRWLASRVGRACRLERSR